MLLCVNHGIFYEFIVADSFYENKQKRISLEDVEVGVNYVIILNTTAGLYGYNIGDTIKFVSLDPYKIVVTGRIKHFTSDADHLSVLTQNFIELLEIVIF